MIQSESETEEDNSRQKLFIDHKHVYVENHRTHHMTSGHDWMSCRALTD